MYGLICRIFWHWRDSHPEWLLMEPKSEEVQGYWTEHQYAFFCTRRVSAVRVSSSVVYELLQLCIYNAICILIIIRHGEIPVPPIPPALNSYF